MVLFGWHPQWLLLFAYWKLTSSAKHASFNLKYKNSTQKSHSLIDRYSWFQEFNERFTKIISNWLQGRFGENRNISEHLIHIHKKIKVTVSYLTQTIYEWVSWLVSRFYIPKIDELRPKIMKLIYILKHSIMSHVTCCLYPLNISSRMVKGV